MSVLRLLPASGGAPVEITRVEVTVGRDPGCEVVVNDGSVSRRHARIQRQGEAWTVTDLGSANGTFLDSQRTSEMTLREGAQLRFGSVAYTVEISPEIEAGATVVGVPRDADATIVQDFQPSIPKPAAAPPPPPPPPTVPPRPTVAMPPVPAPAPPPPPRPVSPPPPPPPRPGVGAGAPPPAIGSPVAPPVARKAGRGPMFWIGAGCCGCLLMMLAFAFLFGGSIFFMTRGAVDGAQGFVKDAGSGQVAAAHARLTDEYKAQMPVEQLQSLVAGHPGLGDNKEALFWPPAGSVNVVNDRAEVKGVLVSKSGVRENVSFVLFKRGGKWLVGEMTLAEAGSPPPSTPSSDGGTPPPTTPAANTGSLRVETLGVQKESLSGGVKVTVVVRVTGFGLREEGGVHNMHLAEDLETIGADGARIDDLSTENFQVANKPVSDPSDARADFTASLTLVDPPPGNYAARITVRDLVNGARMAHEVPFTLP